MKTKKTSKKADAVVAGSLMCSITAMAIYGSCTTRSQAYYEAEERTVMNAEMVEEFKTGFDAFLPAREQSDETYQFAAEMLEPEKSNMELKDYTDLFAYEHTSNMELLYKELGIEKSFEKVPEEETIVADKPVEEKVVARTSSIMKQEPIEVEKYINLDDLAISFDMDVSVRTGLSKEDFVTLIEECPYDYTGWFEENAELLYDTCEEYEINEIFFCGLIAAESGWESVPAHRYTHNYISMMGGGGLMPFGSLEEGIEESAKLLRDNYLTEGGVYYHGTSISGVKVSFCPGSPTWEGLVFGCMSYLVQ